MVSDILCGPHVLAIQLGDIQFFGLLGFVWMLRPGVYAQISKLDAAQRSARDHPLDGLLDYLLGKTALEDRFCRTLLDATDETSVIVVDLVVALAPGQHCMRRVDDDDIVPAIDMGRISRKVLAAKAHRD